MPDDNACAVVITYHPESSVFERLSLLQSQASGLVVVDNGSRPSVLEKLRNASQSGGFRLIENGENRGVASALNTGIRWAIENEYEWVALFDQDSTIPEGYLDAMFTCIASQADPARIAIVAPQYRDPLEHGLYRSRFSAEDGTPLEVMSSGSLLPVGIFEQCGGFEEELFIDQVDHEFCFRVRALGYKVLFCENAIIDHLPGSARRHKLFGKIWITLTDHNPERRYYQTRNGLVLAKRYRKRYPLWSRTTRNELLWNSPLGILFAESKRWKKLLYVARGVVDAYRDRLGKRVNL